MLLSEAKVLVVDDEIALREMFGKWLRASGCANVQTAADGVEALQSILANPVDVLITDVRMPGMTGVELVRELAGRGKLVPCIIFVSAFADVDAREMYDLGVEIFLSKPFQLEELSEAVLHAITDPPALWQAPMVIAPRQTVQFQIEAGGGFELGRGGFSVRSPATLGLGKIAFECGFGHEEWPDLRGQGYVRWRSRADSTMGIEFGYLEEPGREWVVERITAQKPRSYIPKL